MSKKVTGNKSPFVLDRYFFAIAHTSIIHVYMRTRHKLFAFLTFFQVTAFYSDSLLKKNEKKRKQREPTCCWQQLFVSNTEHTIHYRLCKTFAYPLFHSVVSNYSFSAKDMHLMSTPFFHFLDHYI